MADLKALYDEGYKTSHEAGLQNVFDAGLYMGRAQMTVPECSQLSEVSATVPTIDAGNGNPPPHQDVVIEADAGNGNPPPPPQFVEASTTDTDAGNGEPPKP